MAPSFSTLARLTATCALALASGCSLNAMMANGMGRMAEQAAPSFAGYWDEELALDGAPNGILQLEAMRSVAPDSRGLNLELARTYIAYGFGRLEVQLEKAQLAEESAKAERLGARIGRVYARARFLAIAAMAEHDDGIHAALAEGPDALASYLRDAYETAADLEPLHWAALATGYGALVAAQPATVQQDAQLARVMAERVVGVEAGYRHGEALSLLGQLSCTPGFAPEGGLARGTEQFDEALSLTERRAHLVQVHYARSCVRRTGDRELYVALLKEVLEAGDLGSDVRMHNKLARRRAEMYLPRAYLDVASAP